MNLNLLKETTPTDSILHFKNETEQIFKRIFTREITQGKTLSFDYIIEETLVELGIGPIIDDETTFLKKWYDNVFHLKTYSEFIDQKKIKEILIHSENFIQIEIDNSLENIKINTLNSLDHQLALDVLASRNGITWNYTDPCASFYTKIYNNLFRATLIHHSITNEKNSKLFLRRIADINFPLECFNLEDEAKELIIEMINAKKNIIISGATCSGKTSFLSTLLDSVPDNEHVIILEDTHEISSDIDSRTFLLSNDKIAGKSLKDYCSYSLRMRPDRIIIGEMRSKEIVPFILAMNTGHKGLMSTIHANSAGDTINRMGLLFSIYSDNKDITFEVVTRLICKNIDYIIHMESKFVLEIAHIIGSEGDVPYFDIIYTKPY